MALTYIDKNLSNEDYHNHSAISHSAIMTFRRNPHEYYAKYILRQREQTRAMEIGTLVHSAILEPDEYKKLYVIMPEFDKRTTQGKKDYIAFTQEKEGKIFIKEDEKNMIDVMVKYFSGSNFLQTALNSKNIEHSIFFEQDNIQCKTRPDFYTNNGSKIAFDIKTTSSSKKRDFSKSIYEYGYDIQAAMALKGLRANGIEADNFIIVAFEKTTPYVMSSWILKEEALERGEHIFKETIKQINEYHEQNLWEIPNEIDLPNWAYDEEDA